MSRSLRSPTPTFTGFCAEIFRGIYDTAGKGEDTHAVTWKNTAASSLRKNVVAKGLRTRTSLGLG